MNSLFSCVLGVSLLLPRRVAGVRESHVANAQHVHDAQGSQAAVDGVAALHADQTGRLFLPEGVVDVCGGREGGRDGVRRGPPEQRAGPIVTLTSPAALVANMNVSGYSWHILWTMSICSSVCLTASLYCVSQGT